MPEFCISSDDDSSGDEMDLELDSAARDAGGSALNLADAAPMTVDSESCPTDESQYLNADDSRNNARVRAEGDENQDPSPNDLEDLDNTQAASTPQPHESPERRAGQPLADMRRKLLQWRVHARRQHHSLSSLAATNVLPDSNLTTIASRRRGCKTIEGLRDVLKPPWLFLDQYGAEVIQLVKKMDAEEDAGTEAAEDVKRAMVDIKKMEADAKKVETELKRAIAEVKKAETEARKADAALTKADTALKKAAAASDRVSDREVKKAAAAEKRAAAAARKATAEERQAAAAAKRAEVEDQRAATEAKKAAAVACKQAAEERKQRADMSRRVHQALDARRLVVTQDPAITRDPPGSSHRNGTSPFAFSRPRGQL